MLLIKMTLLVWYEPFSAGDSASVNRKERPTARIYIDIITSMHKMPYGTCHERNISSRRIEAV